MVWLSTPPLGMETGTPPPLQLHRPDGEGGAAALLP
jgi:hypothetical protein